MPQLGNLGSQLLQAAKDTDSSLADLITTQKHTIEQERKARFQKIPGKKAPSQKRPRQKTIRRKPTQQAQQASTAEPHAVPE